MDEKIIQELTHIHGKKKLTAQRYAINAYLALRRFELEHVSKYFTPDELAMITEVVVSKISSLDPELILASDHSRIFAERHGKAGEAVAEKLYELAESTRFFLIEYLYLKK